jgi:Pentapeptide repeats (8 copies)
VLQPAWRELLVTTCLHRHVAVTLNVMRSWQRRRMHDLAIIARSRPSRIAGWTSAAILALAAAAAYGLALWRAPGWMHAKTPQDRYNARVLVISAGGALVVGTGLLYTARNYRLSRRGQVTDRFTVALERLGSGELYVRIGGVHALEHVMRDSPGHHDDVIEVLTEFIRDRAPRHAWQSDSQAWMHPVTGSDPDLPAVPTPDIQAALTALGHRPRRPERQKIVLTDLHLTNARLRDANLTGANLDSADLTSAELHSADLTGAGLGGADLTVAQLYRANLNDAWLGGANLTAANLRGADLTGADFNGADLTNAGLDGANLTDAELDHADLTGATLTGANLTDARLGDANLTGAYLNDAKLTGARLDGANLTGARLRGANLTGALLGTNPPVVPPGWVITDCITGELRRATP